MDDRTGLARSAVRFVEAYIRSPSRGTTSSIRARSTSWTPSLEDREARTTATPASTDHRLRIYNDSLPASSQPQTPQNLPEARHQSRLQGAYTAPVQRAEHRSTYHSGTVRGRQSRARSPSGMDTPGFRGLYGGIENSDDPSLVWESPRFHENQDADESED